MTDDDMKLRERVRARTALKYIASRLNEDVTETECLREPFIVETIVNAISCLDEAVSLLADDPTTIDGGARACPVCDLDPSRCERPIDGPPPHQGECAFAADPALRPEPHDVRTFSIPRSDMEIFDLALDRARQVSGDVNAEHGVGALLLNICTDFLATNDFTKMGPEQTQRYFRSLEFGLRRKLVVISADGSEVEYGLKTLARMVGADLPPQPPPSVDTKPRDKHPF